MAKPGGGFFLAEPHFSGEATRLHLLEVSSGRLVDVHDVDAFGAVSPLPVLRDVVVGENELSNGTDLRLETHPITHDTRLIVLYPHDTPQFRATLERVQRSQAALLPKKDDGSATLPVSLVARNATLVLRFDDLLRDGAEEREALHEAVRLTSGYPPIVPEAARIVFDPSHGGVVRGEFHSTRVLIDFTVSEREALELPTFVPINAGGFPASSRSSDQPNGSLHIPTRTDEFTGRFVQLQNLAGHPVDPSGPTEAATRDMVRAFRSGNASDANSGFLLDLARPSVVGGWNVQVGEAADDPLGPAGLGFVLGISFETECRAAPRVGDTLELGGELYEVRAQAVEPDLDGHVAGVRVLRLDGEPLDVPAALLGRARLLTPFRREGALHPACWLTFVPPPGLPPFDGIASDSRVSVRFSEPMDPDTFRAFDTFRVLRGVESDRPISARDLVVGAVRAEQNLQEFSFLARLPFSTTDGDDYRCELVAGLAGVRDLSGTPLDDAFGRAGFRLDANQLPSANGGFALRFQSTDELDPPLFNDLRGQVTYDDQGGILRPRPTAFASYAADRGNPVPSLMVTFPYGVQTPLSALGSKLQSVWRHCDFGWRVRDESFHNIDVIGLSWSPLGGALIADFFPQFEMRMGHSAFVPDESTANGGQPKYGSSGLISFPRPFTDNLLVDPRGPQVVVHPRGLGYRVRPADMQVSGRGTPLLAFPWNRANAPLTTFTWRDTAILAKGGLGSPGVPLDIEVGPPLGFDIGQGQVGASGQVPSIGLPLLWEIRCYPSGVSLGLNSLDILLPVPGWAQPNFRSFSTGGIDQSGRPAIKDPDLELVPSGGYNPTSRPPGLPTPLVADNSFYIGQIDTVVRLSRAVTIWIDTVTVAPRFVEPVVEPRVQIAGTSLRIEYRGADALPFGAGNAPFDSAALDAYGDFVGGPPTYHGDGTWSADLRSVAGARFLQVRFTFVNDEDSSLSPELDSFGIAFEE
ncbi:MAG: hypothetical protein EXS08_06565 [Planctomycetes bacterium]|nr:hypothetical protein [Planctomycetota bacterium]